MSTLIKKLKDYFSSSKPENIYRLDGAVPLKRAIPFGLQHVLAMFVANVVPIFIVLGGINDQAILSQAITGAIFIAGVGTIIQLFPIWRVGSKLPIVVGVSFTFVGVLAAVSLQYGYGTMIGSIIVGGVFIGILGIFAKYWKRFIKPIVSSVVVFAIGLSLLIVGVQQFFGGASLFNGTYDFSQNWPFIVIAFITLMTSLLWQIFVKGVWKNINILFGLAVGYIVSLIFNQFGFNIIDFSSLKFETITDFINFPRLVDFGIVKFDFGAIVTVCIIYLVASTECIGDTSALCQGGLNRAVSDKEISGAIACDGFASALSGCFGSLPLTTFSQNVGIVGQTKVVNRFTILMGALFLILASFFPPIANFLTTIPDCVLGGCMMMLFASIIVIGIKMLSELGFGTKNTIIVSLSLGLGYGITLLGQGFYNGMAAGGGALTYLSIILSNPVANMFVVSLILSYALPDRIDTVANNS